ncbi:MAG: aromatic ring-hydroxylating dioxygenase subunit alpha [Planctomycetes bacterium]|nr:aromatic ring-hydroxylating dioxygenase subunit alpha [Planctomycetota bacterium]
MIAGRKPGCSLPRDFFVDDEIYRLDLDRIWRRSWLFVGHTCQVPEAGDYFTLEVDSDPILVIRGEDGAVRAFHNVCRHRGTLLCASDSGRAGRIVCPYHQWVYAPDGRLLGCRGMQESLDRSELGLLPVRTEVVEGLIFICLGRDPPGFEEARAELAPMLRPQGFERARVAKVIDYLVQANWKIVWENNRECYHCNVNHPQYIKANFDHYNADDTSPRIAEVLASAARSSEEKWAARGLAVTHRETGMTVFPERHWFSVNRTPLAEGYVSETMDGRRAAPLMGEYAEPDVGTLRVRAVPSFWNHSSCDHGVSTRVLPAGPRATRVRVIWVVDRSAVEGKDYRLEELLPFWQLTSEQDWSLCELAQRGVSSSAYVPGPFSTYKEYNVEGFVRWYLRQVSGE